MFGYTVGSLLRVNREGWNESILRTGLSSESSFQAHWNWGWFQVLAPVRVCFGLLAGRHPEANLCCQYLRTAPQTLPPTKADKVPLKFLIPLVAPSLQWLTSSSAFIGSCYRLISLFSNPLISHLSYTCKVPWHQQYLNQSTFDGIFRRSWKDLISIWPAQFISDILKHCLTWSLLHTRSMEVRCLESPGFY